MNRIYFLIFFGIFFSIGKISSQHTIGIIYYEKPKVTSFYEEIKASQQKLYTSTDWIPGSMILADSTLVSPAAFKYDAKNDRMEITLVVDPFSISKIVMGGKFYIHSGYVNDIGTKSYGYFEVIQDGKAKLLQRTFAKKVPGKEGAYGNESYSALDEQDYLKVGEKDAISLKNPENIIVNQFDDKKTEVMNFIQSKKLSVTRKKHLIELIEYYNSL